MARIASPRLAEPRRSTRDYDYLRQVGRQGWAWEWLRRNPRYRRRFADHADRPGITMGEILQSDPSASSDAGQWGLLFRRRP